MKPGQISSTSNAVIKEAVRLKRKRVRYEGRRFLVEGEDLLDTALARGIVPRQVFVLEGHEDLATRVETAAAAGGGRGAAAVEFYSCSETVLAKLSELGSGSRVVAVFELPRQIIPKEMTAGKGPLLYLAGMGDPGNVGTLVRSAASLGACAVALAPTTADPYSPKSLRATMGAIFQLPVYLGLEPVDLISRARAAGLPVICADPHEGVDLCDADLADDFILVLGSEREGVPVELVDAADSMVRIPQEAAIESINVAMAGTIVLYEARRQRAGKS